MVSIGLECALDEVDPASTNAPYVGVVRNPAESRILSDHLKWEPHSLSETEVQETVELVANAPCAARYTSVVGRRSRVAVGARRTTRSDVDRT